MPLSRNATLSPMTLRLCAAEIAYRKMRAYGRIFLRHVINADAYALMSEESFSLDDFIAITLMMRHFTRRPESKYGPAVASHYF